jgi:transcriptional regulator with XRE-family HTH domain
VRGDTRAVMDETSHRIRAARALAHPTRAELQERKERAERERKRLRPVVGLTVDELAARINLDGLGKRTIGDLERDGGAIRNQLTEIAKACGLPYDFFTVDFSTLGAPAGGLDAHRDEMGRNVTERLLDIEEVIRSVEPRLALLEAAHRKQREGQAPADTSGKAAQGRNRRRRADG